LGQLLVLALLIPALDFCSVCGGGTTGTIILSALVAHCRHWMTDRWAVFSRYHIEIPVFDAALGANSAMADVLGHRRRRIFGLIRGLVRGTQRTARSRPRTNNTSSVK
jgi:hypothetical protein